MDEYEIRCMKREELDVMKELSDGANWNNSMTYIQECFDLNPNHFYCAAAPNGRILSMVCWVPVGGMRVNKCAIVAFFLTRPEHQGKGIGRKVISQCLKSVGDFSACLYSMVAVKGIYEKLGFTYTGNSVTGYFCPVSQEKRVAMKCLIPDGLKIIPVHDCNWEDVLKYDRDAITPMPRERCLELFRSQHHAFYVAVKEGQVVGYGCVRRGSKDFQLKPLYADDKCIAQCLMNVLIDTIPSDANVDLQVLADSAEAIAFFDEYGMKMSAKKTVQMFTKEPKKAPNLDRVYSMMDYHRTII